ncbi:MAG: hypothetical protein H6604_06735 [Flavobacteriales bacterium]|nr:hypothetical protein [Flavobacteriales bacterium]
MSSVFAGTLLQAPPVPPVDPFSSQEGDPTVPIDMAIFPLVIVAVLLMTAYIYVKKSANRSLTTNHKK